MKKAEFANSETLMRWLIMTMLMKFKNVLSLKVKEYTFMGSLLCQGVMGVTHKGKRVAALGLIKFGRVLSHMEANRKSQKLAPL